MTASTYPEQEAVFNWFERHRDELIKNVTTERLHMQDEAVRQRIRAEHAEVLLSETGQHLTKIHKALKERVSEIRECNHYTSEYPSETQRVAQNANAIMDALMFVNEHLEAIEELAVQINNRPKGQ